MAKYESDYTVFIRTFIDSIHFSNLDYNIIEVISANDLMKADLPVNYTLRGAPSAHMPRILIILIPAVVLAVFVALNIRMLKKKYHRERYEE